MREGTAEVKGWDDGASAKTGDVIPRGGHGKMGKFKSI